MRPFWAPLAAETQAASPGQPHFDRPMHVAIVGGGLAGCAAAVALAERGAKVTILEREQYLGGRVGAWREEDPHLGSFSMERGFHAFFRQYYNLRALLRRVDPQLSCLTPLADYPIFASGGRAQSFANLPKQTPFNLISLVRRTPTIGMRDLMKIPGWPTLEMLSYEAQRTFQNWDAVSAGAFLDKLRFPKDARELLFDVFAHSFFNPQDEMSAAEMIKLFHFYFTGNPEGLLFDVANRPFDQAIWRPMAAYLQSLAADVRLNTGIVAVHRLQQGYEVQLQQGEPSLRVDAVVLALPTGALQQVVARSPSLDDAAWRRQIEFLRPTRAFAVWRVWVDKSSAPARPAFAGTAGAGLLDNISLYHLFQDESRNYVAAHGGSVVELHGYALAGDLTEQQIKDDLWRNLIAIYPEFQGAKIRAERYRLDQDCPSFRCGDDAMRPATQTPFAGCYLAGDFVKLSTPVALMEGATTSGMVAANDLLQANNVQGHALTFVPSKGLIHAWAPRDATKWTQTDSSSTTGAQL